MSAEKGSERRPLSQEEIKKMLIGLRGYIVNIRTGMDNPRYRQVILWFPHIPPPLKPDNLIGRIVEIRWKGKVFRGRIYRKHGKRHVRAMLEKGLPGQVLVETHNVEVVIVG